MNHYISHYSKRLNLTKLDWLHCGKEEESMECLSVF